jgi:hypothetical protein
MLGAGGGVAAAAAAGPAPLTDEELAQLPTAAHVGVKKATPAGAAGSSSSSAAAAAAAGADAPAGEAAAVESAGSEDLDSAAMCSVCLEPYADGDLKTTLPCFHGFHHACITPWLKQQGRAAACCPMCKTTVFVQPQAPQPQPPQQ